MRSSEVQTTEEWLRNHSLESMQLTLEDLLKKGNVVLNARNATEQIEFDAKTVFGLIKGNKVGLLVDVSDISLYNNFFLIFCLPSLDEARQWVQELQPSGGCNLLKALKKVLTMRELNSLVLIVGSCPDQSSEILCDYIQQCTLGRKLLIHTITYECSSHVPPAVLKNLAEVVGGRYHCYSSKSEVGLVFTKLTPASFLPKPPKHEGPLVVQMPSFLAKTSAGWLKTNGLKAKKLSLYQVLAPNAFSPVEEFVPILQKTVSSTLHEKAMMQFEWHDGTVKNVHVDPPILYDYQKQLDRMVRTYERRIDWLSMASRRIWGTVCELRVVILVDISVTNSLYIIHIQHSLRLLLEEQMSNKDFFNIIAFGSDIKSWKPEMVPCNPENLQSAWRWVLSLQCKGSRNFMSALRRAVEIDLKDKDKHVSQGLYLLTTGVPDQEMHAVSTYVADVCGGCDLQLHVCLFSINGFDPNGIIPSRYASPNETASTFREIAHAANGRFHWFGETGIYESDDISIIVSEMEKAVNYSQKVCFKKYHFIFSLENSSTIFIQLMIKYPKKKSMRRSVPVATLPKEEEICSSKEWLNKYSIKKLKLELPRIMFGPNCVHQKKTVESLHKKVSAKYCTIFPSVEINGIVKHLQFQPKELEDYVEQMEKVLCCYIRRIQWLLSGSRRLFGTILETKVCILIDTSGSMDPYLQQVTKELTSLIWEQLRKNNARFNLLRFAEDIDTWQEFLVEATDETCHDAVQWVSKLQAHGNTCVLKALQKAFCFQDLEALYVVTDGKPDTSCSLILKEVEKIRKKETIKIHTISFNCSDRRANEFLKKLASQTGGRYHRCIGDMDGQLAAHRMLTEGFDDDDDPVFPFFEGDDLKKLAQEVAKARSFLMQAKSFR
uniref:von Willebrand factor A domain containing 3A n=1 Tax=Gopherus evgoodei TaxID=1825980 RepID=A0A8C4VWD0_9SAUR